MNDEPSLERWYAAQAEKQRERERKRDRLVNATSLAEYHEIKLADAVSPPQQTTNNRRR